MLTTVHEILQKAARDGYAVVAANVGNSVEADAAIEAAEQWRAPLILDVLPVWIRPCPAEFCAWLRARCERADTALAINVEDEGTEEGVRRAISYGATSVMADRSQLPFEENIAQIRKITYIAHAAGISVEARLKVPHAGQNEGAMAERFIQETQVDCLSVAVFERNPAGESVIDFPRLGRIRQAVGRYPLVLHGVQGIAQEQIRKACTRGICKVNLSKDLKAAALQHVLQCAAENGNAAELMKAGFRNKLLELIPLYGKAGCGKDRR